MFKYKDLEQIIFDKSNKSFDELIIITGYITPRYV